MKPVQTALLDHKQVLQYLETEMEGCQIFIVQQALHEQTPREHKGQGRDSELTGVLQL